MLVSGDAATATQKDGRATAMIMAFALWSGLHGVACVAVSLPLAERREPAEHDKA